MEKASRYNPAEVKKIAEIMHWTPEIIVEKMNQLGTTVSTRTIENWLNGETAPDADMLDVLAMAMGVGIERFYK